MTNPCWRHDRSDFGRAVLIGLWLSLPISLGAGPDRAPEHSLEGIRAANAEARARLRSLLIELETDDPKAQPPRTVRTVFAVRGESRYIETQHFTAGYPPEVDLKANEVYFEGVGQPYIQFFPNLLYCDTFRKRAPVLSWKIRTEFFLECTGWWPQGDTESAEPRLDSYLHKVLADPRARIRPRQELVDGAWCHVVERPGIDMWWLDPAIGFAPRQHDRDMGEGDVVLPIRYRLRDYREAAPRIWVPWRIGRTFFERRSRTAEGALKVDLDTITRVLRVEVNEVPAERFHFQPPAGTLVHDRDTGDVSQVPGGMEFLDAVATMEEKRARIFHARSGSALRASPEVRTEQVWRLSILLLSAVNVALAWKLIARRGRSELGCSPSTGPPDMGIPR